MFLQQKTIYALIVLSFIAIANTQFHPFENGPGRVSYDQLNAKMGDRTTVTIDSLSINDAALSLLFKIKIYPFRKLSAENFDGNQAVEQARFGGPNTKAGINDRGIVGAGIDFGLPDGSGFGYGQESPFKTFSISRISFVSK